LSTPRSTLCRRSFILRILIGLSTIGFARARCRCLGVRSPFRGPRIDSEKGQGLLYKNIDDWPIQAVHAPELTVVIRV
jgi:hypothetical protein